MTTNKKSIGNKNGKTINTMKKNGSKNGTEMQSEKENNMNTTTTITTTVVTTAPVTPVDDEIINAPMEEVPNFTPVAPPVVSIVNEPKKRKGCTPEQKAEAKKFRDEKTEEVKAILLSKLDVEFRDDRVAFINAVKDLDKKVAEEVDKLMLARRNESLKAQRIAAGVTTGDPLWREKDSACRHIGRYMHKFSDLTKEQVIEFFTAAFDAPVFETRKKGETSTDE